MRGILKDPDAVTDDNVDTLLGLVQLVGTAPYYEQFPATTDIINTYLTGLNFFLSKIYQSFHYQRAFTNIASLGQGNSILISGPKSDPIMGNSDGSGSD